MSRREPQKKKPRKKSVGEKGKLIGPQSSDQLDEKIFDYGGIPERNLKKNLGC